MNLQSIRNRLEQKKGQQKRVLSLIDSTKKKIQEKNLSVQRAERAQIILQTVAKQTQQELEYHISELVTLALSSVFPNPYKFEVEFVIKRGKTETYLYLSKNGDKMDPITACGGGVIDIASFALRLTLWSLKSPRSRNTLVLDEPFRFLSRKLQPKAGLLLKELSQKLNIQIIAVTHNPDLIESADSVFEVQQNKGISQVKEIR